jgi:MinD superfamily P-loop ATPase
MADEKNFELILMDGPLWVGCPVIAAVGVPAPDNSARPDKTSL